MDKKVVVFFLGGVTIGGAKKIKQTRRKKWLSS
jgi:hypothetical protein